MNEKNESILDASILSVPKMLIYPMRTSSLMPAVVSLSLVFCI